MFKPCRGNLTRVQISSGALSQCVGIWKTRLIQNQLLKSMQVQILSLRFMSIWRNLGYARDLGSRAERRESSSLSMDIDNSPAELDLLLDFECGIQARVRN